LIVVVVMVVVVAVMMTMMMMVMMMITTTTTMKEQAAPSTRINIAKNGKLCCNYQFMSIQQKRKRKSVGLHTLSLASIASA